MANERLTLEIVAATSGEAQIAELRAQIEKLTAAAARAGVTGGAAGRQLGEGFSHAVPQFSAASGAIRVLEGGLNNNVRAAERFLATTLKLGPALAAAFPLVGGLAMIGVLTEGATRLTALIQKFDPLAQAQLRAIDTTKSLSSEIAKLGAEIVKINSANFTVTYGKIAGLNMDATDMSKIVAQDQRNTAMAKMSYGQQSAIANWFNSRPKDVTTPTGRAANLAWQAQGRALGSPSGGDVLAAQKDIGIGGAAFTQLNAFELQQSRDEGMGHAMVRAAAQAQKDENDAAAKKVTDAATQRQNQVDAYAKSSRSYGLGPVELAIQKRDEMLATPGLSGGQRSSISASGAHEIALAVAKILADIATGGAKIGADQSKNSAFSAGLFSKQLQGGIRGDEQWLADYNKGLSGTRQSDSANFAGMRDAAGRQSRLAGTGLDPVAAAAQQLAIRQQEIQQERNIIALHSAAYDMDVENFRLTKESQGATLDYMQALAEYTARQDQQFRSIAGGFLEAAFGGGAGVSSFIKSQAEHVAVGAFQNLAGSYAKKYIVGDGTAAHPGIVPHSKEGTFLGTVLKGLPGGPDPMKYATKLDTAGDKLIAAAAALRGVSGGGGSTSTGGFGFPNLTGLAGGLPVSLSGSTANGARYDAGVGLPAGVTDTGSSGGGMSALGKVGTVAGVAAGGFAAYQGFKSGGARGGLAGASAVLGTAALVDPEPISKLILAGAALVTSMAGSLLGDPKQQRANQISKELTEGIYHAPTAINKTVSTNGTYMDRDAMGNLRGSSFSGTPIVRDPYTYWGPGNTPYQSPGSVTSPYSAPPTVVIQHNYQPGAFQMIDGSNLRDHLVANHDAVAEAAAHNMGSGYTQLAQRVQYVAGQR